MGCVSDLDTKPCVANLDARRFCRGYTNPRACMGVKRSAVYRAFNAMLANDAYVKNSFMLQHKREAISGRNVMSG